MDNKGALEWLQLEVKRKKYRLKIASSSKKCRIITNLVALEAAIKALEKQSDNKQEAKAVLNNNSGIPDPRCPICHTRISSNFKFCHRCGQKIDWGE